MDIERTIARELGVRERQVENTAALLDEGNTVPFIARYRKEVTGSLDEEQIRNIADLLEKLRALDERRETILKSIEEQGKLTEELKAQILAAETRTELEDLYQPYKPKRKTRASVARERGLQPLADLILAQENPKVSLAELAVPYLSEQVPDPNQAWGKAVNFTPYPVTMLVNKAGKIVFVHIGAFDNADEVFQKIKAVAK